MIYIINFIKNKLLLFIGTFILILVYEAYISRLKIECIEDHGLCHTAIDENRIVFTSNKYQSTSMNNAEVILNMEGFDLSSFENNIDDNNIDLIAKSCNTHDIKSIDFMILKKNMISFENLEGCWSYNFYINKTFIKISNTYDNLIKINYHFGKNMTYQNPSRLIFKSLVSNSYTFTYINVYSFYENYIIVLLNYLNIKHSEFRVFFILTIHIFLLSAFYFINFKFIDQKKYLILISFAIIFSYYIYLLTTCLLLILFKELFFENKQK
jgi:hypothetical protein